MKYWILSILRGDWRAVAVPHQLLGFGDRAAMESPWKQVLEICDASRTLAKVSRESDISKARLLLGSRGGMLLLWPSAPPVSTTILPRNIIVSPHLDDAALSLGGHMLRWKDDCLVLDIFSSVSWWRFPFDSPTDARIQLTRDAEESLMAKLVGCHTQKMGLPEAPRRGYTLENLFTAEISLEDAQTADSIRTRMQPLLSNREATWYLPLGVGNHVDHRLARNTILAELLGADVTGQHIRFYEDLFYSAQTAGLQDFRSFVPGYQLRVAEQDVIDVKAKARLLQVYGSQLVASQIHMVKEYASRFGRPKERTWALA